LNKIEQDIKEKTEENFNNTMSNLEKPATLNTPTINLDKIIKILYFDGQIDQGWYEHLNVLYSEKKAQCLPNSDFYNLNDLKIFFETQNLKHASPSLVGFII